MYVLHGISYLLEDGEVTSAPPGFREGSGGGAGRDGLIPEGLLTGSYLDVSCNIQPSLRIHLRFTDKWSYN